MILSGKRIGFAFTGSFCTYDKVFQALENLCKTEAVITPIFSFQAQSIDSRFGKAQDFLSRAKEITGINPITTIEEAEPIGPQGLLDVVIIAPCTGNTLAKLSHGIVDSPVLMAAKSHLRNNRPVVIAVSSNDSLSTNLKNIGLLLNTKNIYFVPFKQDNPLAKPNSMVANMDLMKDTIELSLEKEQIQPIIFSS
ncbi:dipicolinate synthase subunit B [Anaerosacchariphilus polymeriproducens]|uniref:Dipicolinate synthase subunit B n=1 Tax=Anaerosacchariphilus polymeriproducens TaxID=1812858 RepID=A0A371AXU4_9FIRM|nr:dipicolinate synthase subunit B [Anaerosacchariphilus polymeriproducens]RDU24386.1 dipicolinate synthase subunit B [Anaerosacchariphilus polymeriproducens]